MAFKLILDTQTLEAMLLLYLVLAMASVGVGFFGAPNGQLRKQVNAWWFIFPVVSLSLFFYPAGPVFMALGIAVLAICELSLHYAGLRWKFLALCFWLLALQAALIFFDIANPARILAWLLLAQALHFFVRRQIDQLLLLLFILLCFGLSFLWNLMNLPFAPEVKFAWLFYLFVITALNDIGQFVSGTLFGKQTIAARISPNKTWQGLAGGMTVSAFVSVTLGLFLHLAQAGELLMLAISLSLGGFVGDLMFSAAKRFLGIKDFSTLIPGHGGILDRVDSLVLTAPLLYVALAFK